MGDQGEDGVLRNIWADADGSDVDIDAAREMAVYCDTGDANSCSAVQTIGFGGLAGQSVGGSTALPVDDKQRSAWRDLLSREGKSAGPEA